MTESGWFVQTKRVRYCLLYDPATPRTWNEHFPTVLPLTDKNQPYKVAPKSCNIPRGYC